MITTTAKFGEMMAMPGEYFAAGFSAGATIDSLCGHPETGFMEYLHTGSEGFLRTNTDLAENARSLSGVTSFDVAAPSLCGRNFLLIECAEDTVIPKDSLEVLRSGILEESRGSEAAGESRGSGNGRFGSGMHRYVLLPTDHGFNSCKFTAAKTVIGYCREVMNNRA